LAWTLLELGKLAPYLGNEEANDIHEQVVGIARSLGDDVLLADALGSQAFGLVDVREYALASALAEECLTLCRAIGNQRGVSRALFYLGVIAITQGDLSGAARLAEEGLAIAREFDNLWATNATELLGRVALERRDYATAGERFRTVLTFHDLENSGSMVDSFELLGGVAIGFGNAGRGATLLGAAENLRERFGWPRQPPEQDLYERIVAAVRAGLSAEAFAAAWNAGRAMSREAIVQFAMQPDEPEPTASNGTADVGLSKRETEVLRLVASGHSNQEIAALLFLSDHTVDRHISNLYRKIDARGRSDATAWALRRGLV
jgi:DNA-binding CsgD family transcriptional regulator/tetratricopeptide (TPR) repeat protein